jgi:hypothetical protein
MTDRDAAAAEGVGVTDLPEVSMRTVTEPAIGRQLLTARIAAFAAAHDTTLVSRADGPAGASVNTGSIAPPAVSADGATVLVSRASGKFGPKAAGTFNFGGPSISADGEGG